MQWVWEDLSFRGQKFEIAHFEAPGGVRKNDECKELDDDLIVRLDRCEAELGACLWHDTNDATLSFLEELRPEGYRGIRVLELGAGAGVCGIALAKEGAESTITDFDALVPLLEINAIRNGFVNETVEGGSSGSGIGGAKKTSIPSTKQRKARQKKKGKKDVDSDDEDFPLEASTSAPADMEDTEPVANADLPATKKLSAKERRKAREARKQGSEEAGDDASQDGRGSCRVQACEWEKEIQTPSLPLAFFDIVVVCDCLYENKDSWVALQAVIENVIAKEALVVLASATLRIPFLEEFTNRMEEAGFMCSKKVTSELATVLALCLRNSSG